ncbi:WYL domain-containing protein [Dactylosporangium sp. NPDC006015]|uniref:helix-turn-helix transcriptional regulator n=1 Tax=Dactylosporangium sp. NPDC006015 TaxID=3154576 RepID=UPI0033BEDD21
MSDALARLLSLLSLLQTPRLWPGSKLAQRLGVSGRTVRRDIDRLRELGYPVHAVQGGLGGYRLTAGTAMPPLLLEDDEAVAVAIGLCTAATQAVAGADEAAVRALRKLLQVLPPRLRRRVETLTSSTVTHPFALAVDPVNPDALIVTAAAIANHERLRFRYRDEDRHVEPRALVTAGRRWYLLAFDLDRDDWRTFRLDRVTRLAATGARAVTREMPGGDVAAFVASRTMQMAPTFPGRRRDPRSGRPRGGPIRRAAARYPDRPAGRDLPVARAAGHRRMACAPAGVDRAAVRGQRPGAAGRPPQLDSRAVPGGHSRIRRRAGTRSQKRTVECIHRSVAPVAHRPCVARSIRCDAPSSGARHSCTNRLPARGPGPVAPTQDAVRAPRMRPPESWAAIRAPAIR